METIMISDAAKEVQVETHVLRYWEEELKLPIQRNKQGHRCYTAEDVERFKKIKYMKEQGLQLKAIKTAMDLDNITLEKEKYSGLHEAKEKNIDAGIEGRKMIIPKILIQSEKSELQTVTADSKEDKTIRLQILLKQMIAETVRETNEELYDNIRQSLLKELDYQFRMQEEREENREKERQERNEEYYKKMDELLRSKMKRKRQGFLFGRGKEEKEEAVQ